jgi:hypothetical protein
MLNGVTGVNDVIRVPGRTPVPLLYKLSVIGSLKWFKLGGPPTVVAQVNPPPVSQPQLSIVTVTLVRYRGEPGVKVIWFPASLADVASKPRLGNGTSGDDVES